MANMRVNPLIENWNLESGFVHGSQPVISASLKS